MMNQPTQPEQTQGCNLSAPRRLQHTHLMRLLLCSVIWGAVSFGCATVNYVTDVIYTNGGYGAVVTLDLEYDPGVYAALLEIDPELAGAFSTSQSESGWVIQESLNGRKVRSRYTFDTLDKLQSVPKLLAGDSGDVSESFIQSLIVTERAIDAETVEYVFTATVVIEETDTALGGDDMLDDYPDLQAALEKAGPATIVVQTWLPGYITAYSRNGASEGEVNGGRVRWNFREDQPGTYLLQAVSRGPSAEAAASDLEEIHRSNQHIQDFEKLMGMDGLEKQFAFRGAQTLIIEVREALGQEPYSKTLTRKELALLEASYFSQFCINEGVKRKCEMPSVTRALPQIKKLALKIGEDEDAVAALESLVNQLVEQDLQKLAERKSAP